MDDNISETSRNKVEGLRSFRIVRRKLKLYQTRLDFSKICRVCLSDTGPLKSLLMVCTAEVFQICTSIEISGNDCMPKQICEACEDLLNKSYSFRQAATRSNLILKQQLRVEVQDAKVEGQENDSELVECSGTEISKQEINDNITIDNELLLDNTLEPAEIIRRIRKRRQVTRSVKKQRNLKCPKCDQTFKKYLYFEAHMRSHFGQKPDIKCHYCEKNFTTVPNLHSHIRRHIGVKKYQCLTCGKNFGYLNVLKNHELVHLGVKKHACHICDAKFVQRYNLTAHLRTHNNERNYICGQCGKKFSQASNLKNHMIRHTGVKNIACMLCDMRFYVKSDLLKHMRSHTAEKPFSCEHCDKTFKSKSFIVVHMRTHTGERPYACDICPKRFMARKDMRNHRMIHTGEKPHKCQICDQAFIQKCALNRHMKGHTDEETTKKSKKQSVVVRKRSQGVEYVEFHNV